MRLWISTKHAITGNVINAGPGIFITLSIQGIGSAVGTETAEELDGCFWYTEKQIEDVINDMEGSSQIKNPTEEAESAILLLDKIMSNIQGNHKRRIPRKVHSALMTENRKWKNPIIYKFDGTHSRYYKSSARS